MTADEDKGYQSWLAELPSKVREVAAKYPSSKCYRSTENPLFHYKISSYGEHKDTGDVTLTLVHGRDSMRPGIATFGQPPDQLLPCDCGKWEPPTPEQKAATAEWIEQERARFERERSRN